MDTHKDIELTFRYLPGEYLQAVRAHQFARGWLVADAAVSGLALMGGLATLQWGGAFYHWLGIIFVGLGLLLPVLYLLGLFMARRMVAREPKIKNEYRLTFSDLGTHFRTEGVDSNIDWSFYQSAVRTNRFYLLYYGRNHFSVVPRRVLDETGETAAFEALLRRHLKHGLRER